MSAPPAILLSREGRHNADLGRSRDRLLRGNTYKDCSTIIVTPAIAPILTRIVQTWLGMLLPMNQKAVRLFVENMEVGSAYSAAVETILANPELAKWKYMLTLETDNAPPPDGLLKLIEDIESGPWAAVGSLYWTKGEGGQPMCYGDPKIMPKTFIPFLPPADAVTECNGLGMGFTLFRLEMFRDARLPRPFFQTRQRYTPGVGSESFTQDLLFFQEAAKLGYRFACSTRALTGHLDSSTGVMW